MEVLRAPFVYFGGKSRAASLVWEALGNVGNYVEPFFGSGAVLLARAPHGSETVNDKSRFLANFWRAIKHAPDLVAKHSDWPENECDLYARHRWLLERLPALTVLLDSDAEAFDAEIAAWWVWGAGVWHGDRWCNEFGKPCFWKRFRLAPTENGINNSTLDIKEWFLRLSLRFRRVRVACGEWDRVLRPAITYCNGLTGVFLDPPYSEGDQQYSSGGTGSSLSAQVREWALEAGKRSDMRVVLCGYEGEHELPGWRVVQWKAGGGYSVGRSGGDGNGNRNRERLWLSPHCERQSSLFAALENA